MQVLNLIRPEKSSVKYKVIQFPDGEPHIALKNIDRKDNLSLLLQQGAFKKYQEVFALDLRRYDGR